MLNSPLELADHGPVIPVIVLQRLQDAVPLAEALVAGGVRVLEVTLRKPVALAGPFPDVAFCPTGGITVETAPQFLALPNVKVCGGSWLTPADAVAAGDWERITRLAREAAALPRLARCQGRGLTAPQSAASQRPLCCISMRSVLPLRIALTVIRPV